MEELIEAINKYQREKNLNDAQFALLLGIDRSTVSLVKRGLRMPGRKFLQAISCKVPELRRDVMNYMSLSQEETEGKVASHSR